MKTIAFIGSGHIGSQVARLAVANGYNVVMGTIRFQPDSPLPAALVRKIVKARMAQNQAAPKGPPSQRFR